MATNKSIGKTASHKPASPRGIKSVNPAPVPPFRKIAKVDRNEPHYVLRCGGKYLSESLAIGTLTDDVRDAVIEKDHFSITMMAYSFNLPLAQGVLKNRVTVEILCVDPKGRVTGSRPMVTSDISLPKRYSVPLPLLAFHLASPEMLGRRMMLVCQQEPMAEMYELAGSAAIVESRDPEKLKWFIEDMVPHDLLGDVMRVGLARARKYGIEVEDSCIRPAPRPPEMWKSVEAPNEAAPYMSVRMISADDTPTVDGIFVASAAANDAMAPLYPKGREVIFQVDRTPQEGEIVLAMVTVTEDIPKPYFWQTAKKQRWEEAQDCADEFMWVIRRYGRDGDGAATLTSLAEDFNSWTEGARDGKITEFSMLAVATDYKTTFRERSYNGTLSAVCRISA
jgi:hypothetical protein